MKLLLTLVFAVVVFHILSKIIDLCTQEKENLK